MPASAPADGVAAVVDDLVDLRRHLHAHPELSFEEHATTALVSERLSALGLEDLGCPTPTGAVFALDGGRPGRTVLLRADLDALPVSEAVPSPYASTVEGVMHACGHDVHTAALVGAATVLADRAADLPGRYVFVFQPAEERLGGARALLDGGLLDRVRPDAAVACHVAAPLPAGLVASRPGLAWTASSSFDVHVHGTGGHGAVGVTTGNVLVATGRLLQGLGGAVTGLAYDGTPCACSAGTVRAGTAPNVLPDRAVVQGTLRTFTADQGEEARGRLAELCRTVGDEEGCRVELVLHDGCPAVRNDESMVGLADRAVTDALGEGRFLVHPPVAPSDDMSEILDAVPGCYLLVGGALPDGSGGMHHEPTFAVDESSLTVAATALVATAVAMAGEG